MTQPQRLYVVSTTAAGERSRALTVDNAVAPSMLNELFARLDIVRQQIVLPVRPTQFASQLPTYSLFNRFCVVVPMAPRQTSWASGQINTRPQGSPCSHSKGGAADHRRQRTLPCPSGERGPPDCPEDGSVESRHPTAVPMFHLFFDTIPAC